MQMNRVDTELLSVTPYYLVACDSELSVRTDNLHGTLSRWVEKLIDKLGVTHKGSGRLSQVIRAMSHRSLRIGGILMLL